MCVCQIGFLERKSSAWQILCHKIYYYYYTCRSIEDENDESETHHKPSANNLRCLFDME